MQTCPWTMALGIIDWFHRMRLYAKGWREYACDIQRGDEGRRGRPRHHGPGCAPRHQPVLHGAAQKRRRGGPKRDRRGFRDRQSRIKHPRPMREAAGQAESRRNRSAGRRIDHAPGVDLRAHGRSGKASRRSRPTDISPIGDHPRRHAAFHADGGFPHRDGRSHGQHARRP